MTSARCGVISNLIQVSPGWPGLPCIKSVAMPYHPPEPVSTNIYPYPVYRGYPMLFSCTLFFFVLIIGTVLAAPASPYVAHGRCPSPDRHITAGSTLPVSGDPDSNNRRSQLVFNVVMLRGDWFRMPMPNDLVCIFRNRTSTQSHILYSILLICQQSM